VDTKPQDRIEDQEPVWMTVEGTDGGGRRSISGDRVDGTLPQIGMIRIGPYSICFAVQGGPRHATAVPYAPRGAYGTAPAAC
jgi:hypothetical protein